MEMNRIQTLECQSGEGVFYTPHKQGRCRCHGVPPAPWDGVCDHYSCAPGWAPGFPFAGPAFALAAAGSITSRSQVSFLPVFHPLQTQLEISSLAPLPSAPREA